MKDSERGPRSLLFSISAGIGGHGLNIDALEACAGAVADGILRRAVVFSHRERSRVPSRLVETLWWHPVRMLKFLPKSHAMGARKHALDAIVARRLRAGGYDLFHSWSGDCLQSLRVARQLGIPSVLEIPTWHRNKGRIKPDITMTEREKLAAPPWRRWYHQLEVSRQQVMEEYALADIILVLSEKARETFRIAGVAEEKLFLLPRGVDVEKFSPGGCGGATFRAIFCGSLIRRKGIHTLLEGWQRAGLRDAELRLVGGVHRDVIDAMNAFPSPNVTLVGFSHDVPGELRGADVHVFPTGLEGSAKVTYEAAACGLAQITTRAAGDVVIDGFNGIVVEPDDPAAVARALCVLHGDRALCRRMGEAARQRVASEFTWDNYRSRLREAWMRAWQRHHLP